MKKEKFYRSVKFSSEKIKEGLAKWSEILPPQKGDKYIGERGVKIGDESWKYDCDAEFFMNYQENFDFADYEIIFLPDRGPTYSFRITVTSDAETHITVIAPSRGEIQDIFYVFENNLESYKIPEQKKEVKSNKPVIFIGHGRSKQWRELKDHLAEKHGFTIETYETGVRAGQTIRDILNDMMTNSSMAFLVLTGEDERLDGSLTARPNVIHETGLFQGKLGFTKAIIILEDGTEEFSNIFGINQIRFAKDNIKESFGEVLATIRREFPNPS